MHPLRASLAPYWQSIQCALFPRLECVLGPLTKKQQLVETLEVIRIERWIPPRFRVPGRPPKDRAAVARAFVAKAVYDLPTTRMLLDRLDTDAALRRLCGWERRSAVPSESVFSRAFAEFAHTQLPQRVHEALIRETHRDRLVGHLSRDATVIEAREKPAAKEQAPPPPKRKRGRPKKGEERPKRRTRLERQATMTLSAMLDDLPTDCDVGTKKNSKGFQETWVGYKLHIDVADGQIPISCLLSSASLHDSQAAIPLATMSAARTTNLYDLMDAAYDAEPIRQHSRGLSRWLLNFESGGSSSRLRSRLCYATSATAPTGGATASRAASRRGRSRQPRTRRKCFSASTSALATQRWIMWPSRHRLTFRV